MLTARFSHCLATFFFVSLLTTSANAAEVKIVKAEFGLFEPGEPGEVMFSPTLTVPRKDGQRYGWVIEVGTDQRSLLVREEYLHPAKAPHGLANRLALVGQVGPEAEIGLRHSGSA